MDEFASFRGDKDPVRGGRLDFIYTSLNGSAGNMIVSAAGVNTYKDANGIYPSDHLPVQSRLRLP